MRGIRVIAKKVGKMGIHDKSFISYINKLTKTAQNRKGFQSSSSYWENDCNSLTTFSISDWESKDDWDNWLNSYDRKLINTEHKKFILSEEFSILIKSKKNDDTFLL